MIQFLKGDSFDNCVRLIEQFSELHDTKFILVNDIFLNYLVYMSICRHT